MKVRSVLYSEFLYLYVIAGVVADAVKTYELTWAIREATERSRAEKLRRSAKAAKAEA